MLCDTPEPPVRSTFEGLSTIQMIPPDVSLYSLSSSIADYLGHIEGIMTMNKT